MEWGGDGMSKSLLDEKECFWGKKNVSSRQCEDAKKSDGVAGVNGQTCFIPSQWSERDTRVICKFFKILPNFFQFIFGDLGPKRELKINTVSNLICIDFRSRWVFKKRSQQAITLAFIRSGHWLLCVGPNPSDVQNWINTFPTE